MSHSLDRHWHVISGLQGGYLPTTNEVYQTRRQATQAALAHVATYRDEGEATRGNARSGFWQARKSAVLANTFWDYVTLDGPCSDPEHLTSEWQDAW